MGEEQMFGIFHPAFIPLLTFQDHKIKKVDSFPLLLTLDWWARDEEHMAIQSYRLKGRRLAQVAQRETFPFVVLFIGNIDMVTKAVRRHCAILKDNRKAIFSFSPLSTPRAHISDDPFRKPIFRFTRFRQLRRKIFLPPFFIMKFRFVTSHFMHGADIMKAYWVTVSITGKWLIEAAGGMEIYLLKNLEIFFNF